MSISTVHTPRTQSGAKPTRRWLAVLARSAKHRIVQISKRIMEWRRERRDSNVLLTMHDHLLADIGVGRREVEHAIRHGRWHDSR